MTMIFQSTLPPSLFSAGVYCRKRALVQLPAIINVEHQHICPSDKEVETRTFLLAGKIQKDVIRTLFTQIVAVLIHRDESVDRALLDIKPVRFTIDSITVFAPPNGVSLLASFFHVSNAALFEMGTLK